MKWINAVLLVLAVFLCSSAGAEERGGAEEGLTFIYAFADTSCGEWKTSANSKIGRAQYESWFRGFVTGYNWGNQDNQVKGGMPQGETLVLYVDKFCRENPLESFTTAVVSLIGELLKRERLEQAARKSDPK